MPVVRAPAALRLYYFITFGAMGFYLPYFPSWLKARGFSGAEMGLLMAAHPLCQLVSPTLVGMLADKFSLRGRLMTVCAISTALGLSLFALAAYSLAHIPFVVAALCMLVFAALRSPIVILADILALEIAPDYGRMRLFGSLGFGAMALLGGQLIDPTHRYALPVSVAGMLWLLALVSFLLPKTAALPPRPALGDAKELMKQPAYRRLLVTMMLVFGGMTAYDLCATLRLRELSASGLESGLFWAIATSSEVLLLIWGVRISDRVGPGKLLTLACAVAAVRWVFLSQASDVHLILAFQPLHGISFGLMWVSAMGVLRRETGEKGAGTAQGLYSTAIAVGATIGIASWGTYYDAFGSESLFLTAACVSTLAALSASTLIRLERPLPRSV